MFGPTLREIAPTSHLLCLVLRKSGSRKDIPLSFTARTHTHTLMLTRMMSRDNLFFKHLLQDWILTSFWTTFKRKAISRVDHAGKDRLTNERGTLAYN